MKTPNLDEEQLEKATVSLLKYVNSKKNESTALFDEDEMLYMQIALKKMPLKSRKDKPISIPVPHPLYSTANQDICLFVKDHKGEGHKEAKEMMKKFEKNGGVSKVIGLSKLRTKYESHESKRELCKAYDLFLADDRILPSLPKLIGKSFFKKKKQPIPISLRGKDIPAQIKNACNCTYMFPPNGTSFNIRIGKSSFSKKDVTENAMAVLSSAVKRLPKQWADVQGVYLKTAESVALPVYQTLPDAPVKIDAGKTK